MLLPTYNSAAHVEATIRSLRHQTSLDWECVVSDHSSTDSTLEVVRGAIGRDDRFIVLEPLARSAPGANWNRALRHSRGEYVKLLCADDLLYPECLAAQARVLDDRAQLALVTGGRDVIRSDGGLVIPSRSRGSGAAREVGLPSLRSFMLTGSNPLREPSFVLFRRSSLEAVGGFAEEWAYLIDVMTYAAVLSRWPGAVVDEPVGAFRLHGASWSSSLRGAQSVETRRAIESLGRLDELRPTRLSRVAGAAVPPVASRLRHLVQASAERYPGRLPVRKAPRLSAGT